MAEIGGNQEIEQIKKMLDELMIMQKGSEQTMLAAIKQVEKRYNKDVRRLEEHVEKKIAEAVKNLAPKLGSTISNLMSPAVTKACKSLQGQISAMVPERLETTVVKTMEDALKASSDTLWASFQEENSKQKNLLEEHTDLILSSVKESLTQELPSILEKILKEIASEAFQEALKSVSV